MKALQPLRKFVSIMLLCVGAFAAQAEIPEPTFEQQCWPDAYSTTDCQMVTSPTSACNQGVEPFSKFLEQWNASPEFRQERVNSYPGGSSKEELQQSLSEDPENLYGLLPAKAHKGTRKAKCATFYAVSDNFVAYGVWLSFPNQFCGYLQFARDTDGLWYLVEINYY
jgi:hypothetical protein